VAAFVPILIIGGILGLVAWLAVVSIRRRRVGWIVVSGLLSVFIGTLALGLLRVGYGVGCALGASPLHGRLFGAAGCSKGFFASVFSSVLATSWFAASAGLVLFGFGLCGYAVHRNVSNRGEGRPTRPVSRR
jgi:hypothetical protein